MTRGWGIRHVQLGVLGRRAARAGAARVGERRLLPPLVRQLPGHRQPARSTPADYSPFSITAPGSAAARRRRLRDQPGSTTSTRTRSARSTTCFTAADNFGKQTEHWNGVDVTVNARLRQRHPAAGRPQHRPDVDRQLRRRRARCDNPSPLLLPRRDTKFLTPGQAPRHLHGAEDRRAARRRRSRASPGRRSRRTTTRRTPSCSPRSAGRCRAARPT